jgi:hypothetical protein
VTKLLRLANSKIWKGRTRTREAVVEGIYSKEDSRSFYDNVCPKLVHVQVQPAAQASLKPCYLDILSAMPSSVPALLLASCWSMLLHHWLSRPVKAVRPAAGDPGAADPPGAAADDDGVNFASGAWLVELVKAENSVLCSCTRQANAQQTQLRHHCNI